MTLLIVGIILWWAAHLVKRLAPDLRAAMTEKVGGGSKGVCSGVIVLSVVLMVIGYRGVEFSAVYDPPSWGKHLNNLLMLVAVILFGLGSSKSPLRAKVRHPMLTGMLLWAVAHLLANGDLASVVLFGTMAVWAVVEMLLINSKEPVYHRYEGGSNIGTVRLLVISAVVFVVIAAIHTWLGYSPFGA